MKSLKLHVTLVLTVLMLTRIYSIGQTTLLWSETAGTSVSAQKSFVATDLLGNIYMASSVNGTYGLDWKVSSWRPDSLLRWTYTYNGSGNQDDVPAAIVVDSAFCVYVAGTTKSSGSKDIRVIKLDSAGNLKWGTNYNRTGSAHDVGTGLAVVGNKLWVSGHSQQSSSNYDYTLLKYDTAGTLSWSRHANGSASGDDYTTSLAVRSNGDAYVTGSAVVVATGSVRDIMTLRYTTDGTLQWTKYYGGTSGQHDYGNAVKVDASGNILVTGQTFAAANNSDLVLIKYTSGGTQSWVATYSGTGKKHDAGNALIVGSDGYYYVTGFTQTTGGTNNYVTIRYNSSGSVSWAQTYDGPGASDDEACAILEDGSDIVVTGKSTGSGTGLDVCTISMVKTSGTVNWTVRVDESGSSGDWGYSLARDEMGNVCVVGISQVSGTSFVNIIFKFNQVSKNNVAITSHLEMLGKGVLGIASDTTSKRILYDMVNLVADSFYQANLSLYLAACDQQSTNTRSLIRAALVSNNGMASGYAWEKILEKRIYYCRWKMPSMIFVPGFETFTRNGFISTNSAVAFSWGQLDFPITSLPSHGSLYESNFLSIPTLTVIALPPAWWHKNVPIFRRCTATKPNIFSHTCAPCSANPTPDGLPIGDTCGTATMSHEVGIYVGYNYHGTCGIAPVQFEQCLTVSDLPPEIDDIYFAMLYALPYCPFYERIGDLDYLKIKKIQHPIYDVDSNLFASGLVFCSEHMFFNDFHGITSLTNLYTERYALGWGGIYKVFRPGANQRPLYFTLPYTKYLRYVQGPDMNFYYGQNHFGNLQFCTGTVEETQEDYFIGPCEICNQTETSFGLTQNQAADQLVTTDIQTISNFWSDNAITVVFTNLASLNSNNVHTFYASGSPTPCNAASYSPDSLLSSSVLFSDGTYEVQEKFMGNVTFPAGTSLLIHVRAKYLNGESIDECRVVTLATGQNGVAATGIEIRGNIADYSPTVNNYQVDIYLM